MNEMNGLRSQEQDFQAYDNWPPSVRQINPGQTKYHWRVPIELLSREERDERILESPMQRIVELCAQNPPMPYIQTKQLVAKRDRLEVGSPEYNETVGAIAMGAIRLCVHIAKIKRRGSMAAKFGMDMSDLVQEGYTGALRAAQKMEVERMTHPKVTSTYMSKWIEQKISRAIANQSRLVRLPVHVHEQHKDIIRAESRLERELGRTPSDYEVACAINGPIVVPKELEYEGDDSFDLPYTDRDIVIARRDYDRRVREVEGEVKTFRQLERRTSSLSIPSVSERADAIHNDQSMEERVHEKIQSDELHDALFKLDDRERQVMEMRFFELSTLDVVAEQLGISRERVSQIEYSTLKKLRRMPELKAFQSS